MHTKTKSKNRTPTNNGKHKTINHKQQNRRLRTEQQPKPLGGGVNAFYWHQIIALDYVVVKSQKSV